MKQVVKSQVKKMKQVIDETKPAEWPTWRKLKTVQDGMIQGELHIEIDLDQIIDKMGAKALLGKSGRCVDGFVVVKAVNRKHIV